MGIINVTPDSFFEDSRQQNIKEVVSKAEQMLHDGATIIDIGGQTTKPGSEAIGASEEMKRVIPVIKALVQTFPGIYISIDTYHAIVAKAAVEAGACMVNDISGGMMDTEMLITVASLNVPYICMHMQGTPQTMQVNPTYENVTKEVLDFFIERMAACRQAGIKDVIVDVGFGFGKTIAHNFQLLKEMAVFKMLDAPILAGLSRKSTVYKTLGISAKEALNGTTVLNTIALQNGADILRVHDVKEAKEAIVLVGKLG
ncbi:dihydropteroate synthase [Parasediminibacterium paludis]|uniref:dihydropteroate synthase n=1 Tax=Parasediminibacterium paludis TaxID=908966 RepID=A0ABV8PZZ2_9BACT